MREVIVKIQEPVGGNFIGHELIRCGKCSAWERSTQYCKKLDIFSGKDDYCSFARKKSKK